MSDSNGCIGGPLTPHNYQPRYDEIEPKVEDTFFRSFSNPTQKNKIWVADVCANCGHLIPRQRG